MSKWSIQGVTIVTPDKVIERGNVLIDGDEISDVSTRPIKSTISMVLDDEILCPGLINSHDHLIGNYWPKVGDGRPYTSWLPWDNDLKSADVYRERQQIENRDLYLLAGYRNLLSGVTSVSDHIPHFVNEPYIDLLPMKIIADYALSHSVSSDALAWGDGIIEEHAKAVKNNLPYVVHCSEGYDPETVKNIPTLERLGALSEHSVLIHGIAFSKQDIDLIKQRNANVVWCCDSNIYMYEKTTDIKYLLEKGVNVSIGTDSPMSGGENLLYEMRFGKEYYKKANHQELADKQIVKMVTTNAAKAFRLKRNGRIESGNLADMVLFANKGDPYKSIVDAELKDVKLIVIDGYPVYGDQRFSALFDDLDVEYTQLRVQGVDKVVIGNLVGLLERISRVVGFKKTFPFMPIDFTFEK